MTCQKAREWIPLLAGDDLPPRRAARLRKHLANCPDCRREFETMRASLEAMKAAARGESVADWPESAWKALLARITAGAPGFRKPMPGPGLRWAFVAGAAGVLLVAGLLFLFKDRIFRPEGISSIPGPVIVEKTETPSLHEAQPKIPENALREKPAPETEPRILAARKPEAGLEIGQVVSPTPVEQDVISVTLVSRESGLQVVWFFDKNFEWKGDER